MTNIISRIKEIFLFRYHAENEAGRLVLDLFFFFIKKAVYKVKASGLHLNFKIFSIDNFKIGSTDPEICSILIF